MAAILHGSARVTLDADIVYDRGAPNLNRLAEVLQPLKPTLRGASSGLPFKLDVTTLRNGLNFRLATNLGDLDLFGEVTAAEVMTTCCHTRSTLTRCAVQSHRSCNANSNQGSSRPSKRSGSNRGAARSARRTKQEADGALVVRADVFPHLVMPVRPFVSALRAPVVQMMSNAAIP